MTILKGMVKEIHNNEITVQTTEGDFVIEEPGHKFNIHQKVELKLNERGHVVGIKEAGW